MSRSLRDALAAHPPTDLSVRVVSGLFSVLPFAPTWAPGLDLTALERRHGADVAARILARLERLTEEPGPQSALATFDFLDKSDTGIAVFTGLRGAVKVAQGQAGAALEMDPQQAADAGLKAAGIAWVVWKLLPGSAAEKLRAFGELPAGRALLTWYVAADLVLPFADNLAAAGVEGVTGFLDTQAAEHAARLGAVGGSEVQEAAGMLREMLTTVRGTLGQAAVYAGPLTAWAKEQLPGVLGVVDKATGVLATGVDTLGTYRCIGATVVAEALLPRATAEVLAEVEAERLAAEEAAAQARAAEEARRAAEARAAEAAAEAEAARRRGTAQQERYTLDDAVEAASLRNNPVKVTRGADVPAPSEPAPPARSGCLGCGAGLVLLGLAVGALLAGTTLV